MSTKGNTFTSSSSHFLLSSVSFEMFHCVCKSVCSRSCACRHTCGCRYTCTFACMGKAEETSAVFPQTPHIYWPRTNQVEQIGWPVSPGSLPLSIPSPLTLKGHTTMLRFLKTVSLFKIFIQYLLIMFSLSKFLPDLPRLPAYPVSCPFCLFLIWFSGIKLTLLHSQGKHFTD